MKSVFAGSKSRDIGNDFHAIAGFRERHRTRDVASGSSVQDSDRFRRLLGGYVGRRNGDCEDEETAERKNFDRIRFHGAKIHPRHPGCKLRGL